MRTTKVGYIHSFNVSGFLNDKAIIEVELDEGDDEDVAWDYVLAKTREIADKASFAPPQRIDTPHKEEPSIQINDDYRKKTVRKSPEEKRWEAIIEACCSVKEVEKWRNKIPEGLKHLCDNRIELLKLSVKQ